MTTPRPRTPSLGSAATHPPSPMRLRRGVIVRRLLAAFLGFMLITAAALTVLHLSAVRGLVDGQLGQRALELSHALGVAVAPPMLLRNYLAVNLAAEQHAQLPGVAYVAVLNQRSALVAGLVGHPERFAPGLASRIAAEGFPADVLLPENPGTESPAAPRQRAIQGLAVLEAAAAIPDANGHVVVGLFATPLEQARRKVLYLLWGTLGGLTLLGAGLCLGLGRRLEKSMADLLVAAERQPRQDIAPPPPGGGGRSGDRE